MAKASIRPATGRGQSKSNSKRKGGKSKDKARPKVDLDEILGEFSDALAFIECVITALQSSDDSGPELLVLEHGARELRRVYSLYDRASMES